MRNWVTGLVAIAVFAASLSGVDAKDLSKRQVHEADKFAINNTWFVLYHELGHMLIDQLGIPVLAREEDAADNIATFALLARETGEADQALLDASKGWSLSDRRIGHYESADFYDQHSLDVQRAYNIACLMVGNDRKKFHAAADRMKIDEERQKSCADDYAQVQRGLVAVLSPYLGHKAPITVVYDKGGKDYDWAERILKRSHILEKTAEDIDTSFALPKPITIHATLCDEANAFYDPDTKEVLVCYELLGDYFDLIADDMLRKGG